MGIFHPHLSREVRRQEVHERPRGLGFLRSDASAAGSYVELVRADEEAVREIPDQGEPFGSDGRLIRRQRPRLRDAVRAQLEAHEQVGVPPQKLPAQAGRPLAGVAPSRVGPDDLRSPVVGQEPLEGRQVLLEHGRVPSGPPEGLPVGKGHVPGNGFHVDVHGDPPFRGDIGQQQKQGMVRADLLVGVVVVHGKVEDGELPETDGPGGQDLQCLLPEAGRRLHGDRVVILVPVDRDVERAPTSQQGESIGMGPHDGKKRLHRERATLEGHLRRRHDDHPGNAQLVHGLQCGPGGAGILFALPPAEEVVVPVDVGDPRPRGARFSAGVPDGPAARGQEREYPTEEKKAEGGIHGDLHGGGFFRKGLPVFIFGKRR